MSITPKGIQRQIGLALTPSTQQVKNDHFRNVAMLLQKHANILQSQNEQIRYQYYWLDRYRVMYDLPAEKPAIKIAYDEGKILNIFNLQKIILVQAKNGYEIIMTVREALTGQKIVYRIGIGKTVGGQKNAAIIEAQMGYNQIESGLYIERHRGQLAIRFTNSQKKIKEKSVEFAQEIGQAIASIDKLVSEGSTLWSAVYRFRNDERYSQQKKGNWGNAYQVYRYLYNRSPNKPKNNWNPHANTISKAFREVLGGGGSTGSFIHGGDSTLTEQDKFGSNITLTSVSTIINIERELSSALINFINSNDTEQIVNLLTREQVGDVTIEIAYEEAVDTINKNLLGTDHNIIINLT